VPKTRLDPNKWKSQVASDKALETGRPECLNGNPLFDTTFPKKGPLFKAHTGCKKGPWGGI